MTTAALLIAAPLLLWCLVVLAYLMWMRPDMRRASEVLQELRREQEAGFPDPAHADRLIEEARALNGSNGRRLDSMPLRGLFDRKNWRNISTRGR